MLHMMNQQIFTTEVSRVPVAEGNTRISVTLSKEVHDKIKELAQKEHRTVSAQAAFEIIKSLEERGRQNKASANGS